MSDLNVRKVYATEAEKDGTADWGRGLTFGRREDPLDRKEVVEFSSDAGNGGRAVTGHDMYPEADTGGAKGRVGYLSPRSVSLINIAQIVANGRLE